MFLCLFEGVPVSTNVLCFQVHPKSENKQASFLYLNPYLYRSILKGQWESNQLVYKSTEVTLKFLMPTCFLNIIMSLMPEDSISEGEEQSDFEWQKEKVICFYFSCVDTCSGI